MDALVESPVAGLRALGDPLRWRIVELLAGKELCVCHLVEELGVGQSLISHHLRVLREAGLIESERFRYWTYYRLRPEALRSLADRVGGLGRQTRSLPLVRRPCC